MKRFGFALASVLLCTIGLVAQDIPNEIRERGTGSLTQDTRLATHAAADDRPESDATSTVSSVVSQHPSPKFAPMTRGERFRSYLVRVAGPQPFITAAAAAGISQAENTPKEWSGALRGMASASETPTLNNLFAEPWSTVYPRLCMRTIATSSPVKLVSFGEPGMPL